MAWKSNFIFRIILGLIMIAQYFFGFDGKGHGTGNMMFLMLGTLFIGYGSYGFVQRAALRKRTALNLGLQADASWEEIERALLEKKKVQ